VGQLGTDWPARGESIDPTRTTALASDKKKIALRLLQAFTEPDEDTFTVGALQDSIDRATLFVPAGPMQWRYRLAAG
jgi:hypothetical protein